MNKEDIIQNKIKEMKRDYPDWVVPEIDSMYCFSINQTRDMMKQLIEEFEQLIVDEFSFSVCEQLGECQEHNKCIRIKIDKLKGSSLLGTKDKKE